MEKELLEGVVPARNAISIEAITFDGKDPDEIKYLLLLHVFHDDDEDYTNDECHSWLIKTGRQNVYNYLKDMIEAEAIDPNMSFIVSETVTLKKAGTVSAFMKDMKDNQKVIDGSGFDVTEYNYAAYDEEYPINIFDLESSEILDDDEEDV